MPFDHQAYQAARAAAESRKTLAQRCRTVPATGAASATLGEAADAIDYLHAQIDRMRREAIEEQREFQREARDIAAEARWEARAEADDRAAFGY